MSELPYTCAEVVCTDTPRQCAPGEGAPLALRAVPNPVLVAGAGAAEALTKPLQGTLQGKPGPRGPESKAAQMASQDPTSKGCPGHESELPGSQEHYSPNKVESLSPLA